MQDPSEFRQTAKSKRQDGASKTASNPEHWESSNGLADKMGILIPVVQVFILSKYIPTSLKPGQVQG